MKFALHKKEILEAVQSKIDDGVIVDPKGFTLINKFVNVPLHETEAGLFDINSTIPAVAVVGKSTGLIHTFSLKLLLPEIEL